MRLSILFELLLVFIIIAFGAAKPLSKNEPNNAIQTYQKISVRQEESFLQKNQTSEDDDYDIDEDDIFGLGISNDEKVKDKDQLPKPSNNTEEDEDELDDEDDEKDSEEDPDESEFLLFGEDLFGLFDDGNKTKKKKVITTTTSLPLNVFSTTSSPLKKIKNRVNEQSEEQSIVSIGAVQEVVNQLTPVSNANKDSIKAPPQLHLQHTTALLELAQNSGMQEEEEEESTTMQGILNIYEMDQTHNKSDMENAVQIGLDINASEQSENVETSLSEFNTVSNVLQVKKDTQVALPISTLPTKKQTQKQDNSFFGLVESLISADDDDIKTEDENDSSEISGEDEEEADNDEETEASEEENVIKDKNKKKKSSGVIGSIGESFSLLG